MSGMSDQDRCGRRPRGPRRGNVDQGSLADRSARCRPGEWTLTFEHVVDLVPAFVVVLPGAVDIDRVGPGSDAGPLVLTADHGSACAGTSLGGHLVLVADQHRYVIATWKTSLRAASVHKPTNPTGTGTANARRPSSCLNPKRSQIEAANTAASGISVEIPHESGRITRWSHGVQQPVRRRRRKRAKPHWSEGFHPRSSCPAAIHRQTGR